MDLLWLFDKLIIFPYIGIMILIPNLTPKKCLICKSLFYRKRNKITNKLESLVNFRKRKYCSHKCYAESLKESVKGNKNPHWKGGRSSNKEYLREYKRKLYRKYHPFLSEEDLWKIRSKAQKGRKHSKETKEKIRQCRLKNPTRYWFNKKRPEMRKKVKSNWKEFRKQLRERTEYKQWIRYVFRRDNYTCQLCSRHGGDLQAHHLLSAKKYPEYILETDNGVTLCKECHKELNGNWMKPKIGAEKL